LVNFNDDFKATLIAEKYCSNTKYVDYVDRIMQRTMEKARKKPDFGTRLVKYYGRPGGKCNYVECEFIIREDANTVADELAEFIFKEAELIEYEPAENDSPWAKVARGILNPMS
jgi:ssDNA-binding Zn-finger/Zn-ribbon topoisomerase 1